MFMNTCFYICIIHVVAGIRVNFKVEYITRRIYHSDSKSEIIIQAHLAIGWQNFLFVEFKMKSVS